MKKNNLIFALSKLIQGGYRMRKNKKNKLIEEMYGERCQGKYCDRSITTEDVEELQELQGAFPLEEYEWEDGRPVPRCVECYEEWFQEQEFFQDYNPMHPEETREEFDEHEDYEPKD